jgi:hypothetical protein
MIHLIIAITSRLTFQMYMKPRTPASIDRMVKMTQKEAAGLGMRTTATKSMMMVPAARQLTVEGMTPMN